MSNPIKYGSLKSYKHLEASNIDLDFYYCKSLFKNLEKQNISYSQEFCCVCGHPDLLIACTQDACRNSFHFFCVSAYFPELLTGAPICPAHSFKELSDYSRLLFLSSRSGDSSIKEMIKSRPDYKRHLDLPGKLFWFTINFQYFPYFSPTLPDFFTDQIGQTSSWVDSEIQRNQKKMLSMRKASQSLLPSPVKTSLVKNPKLGQNLSNSCKLRPAVSKKLRKNHEKYLAKTMDFVPKDYQNFLSDDSIVCAVCDDGSSIDYNLIVICSGCSLPVHSKCYNIFVIPDDDWLCDPCQEGLTAAQCSLCPIRKGALKRAKPNSWVHVNCARYLQNKLNGRFDIRKIDKEKFKLKCFSCQKREGACVRCSFSKCSISFHVECRKDLFELDSQNQVVWLCPTHKASKVTRLFTIKQEASLEYIRALASEFWIKNFNETIGEKKSEKKNEEKKFVIEMFGKMIRVKVFVGGKIVKAMRFLEDNGCRDFGQVERCCELNCSVFEQEISVDSEGNRINVQSGIRKDCQVIKKRKIGCS